MVKDLTDGTDLVLSAVTKGTDPVGPTLTEQMAVTHVEIAIPGNGSCWLLAAVVAAVSEYHAPTKRFDPMVYDFQKQCLTYDGVLYIAAPT
jgi:hypothetical protein